MSMGAVHGELVVTDTTRPAKGIDDTAHPLPNCNDASDNGAAMTGCLTHAPTFKATASSRHTLDSGRVVHTPAKARVSTAADDVCSTHSPGHGENCVSSSSLRTTLDDAKSPSMACVD